MQTTGWVNRLLVSSLALAGRDHATSHMQRLLTAVFLLRPTIEIRVAILSLPGVMKENLKLSLFFFFHHDLLPCGNYCRSWILNNLPET